MDDEKNFFGENLPHPVDKEAMRIFSGGLATHFTEASVDDNTVTIRGNGVTSTFTLDPSTHKFTLDAARSRDLFENDATSHFESDSLPLKSAAEIHAERQAMLEQLLNEAVDPVFIEDDAQ